MYPRLYLTDKNGDRQTELLDYSSVVYHQPFNAVGKWRITVPRDIGAAILKGWGIEMQLPSGDLLTGIVVAVNTKPGVSYATVYGLNDLYKVRARAALPEANGDFAAQAYDVRTGAVETVVKGYVKDNASKDALIAERAWPFSVATDQGRGNTITGRARFHNLLSLSQSLIAAAGNAFRMSLNNGVFEMEPVSDYTGAPMFADWMSGVEFGWSWQAPEVDYLYAGGQGEGTARLIVERYAPIDLANYWRVEDFLDYRSADDANELLQSADARLAKTGSQEGYQVQVAGTGMYGTKYKEGDLVTVQVGGKAFDARIEGVALRYEEGKGWREEVGIGIDAVEGLIDALRQADLTERVRNLEVI